MPGFAWAGSFRSADWRVSALPVVDDTEHILGMLSYVDMMRGMKRRGERQQPPRPEPTPAPPG